MLVLLSDSKLAHSLSPATSPSLDGRVSHQPSMAAPLLFGREEQVEELVEEQVDENGQGEEEEEEEEAE